MQNLGACLAVLLRGRGRIRSVQNAMGEAIGMRLTTFFGLAMSGFGLAAPERAFRSTA